MKNTLIILLIVAVIILAYFAFVKPKSANDVSQIPPSATLTILPKYVGEQSNWPPVIQNSSIAYSCTPDIIPGDVTLSPTTTQKVIGGKTYCIITTIEGALGSRYGEYTYITANGLGTKKTNFILKWPSCDNFDNSERAQCQTEQTTFFSNLDALIDSLM